MNIAGAEMLVHEDNRRRKLGERLYFYKMEPKPKQILESSGHIDSIETDAFFSSKATTLKEVQQALSESRCENCQQRIFTEYLDLYGQSSR